MLHLLHLTHLYLVSHERDIGKRCRPRLDATERGVWSGSTPFVSNTGISITHGYKKHDWPDVPFIGDGVVQRHQAEESILQKWVQYFSCEGLCYSFF